MGRASLTADYSWTSISRLEKLTGEDLRNPTTANIVFKPAWGEVFI